MMLDLEAFRPTQADALVELAAGACPTQGFQENLHGKKTQRRKENQAVT
jgi:hypothetical protein